VADIWEEGARQVTEQYGIPKYVTDYKDLIASPDVEAVLICSPTDQVCMYAAISMRRALIDCAWPVCLAWVCVRQLSIAVCGSSIWMDD